jgi:hypothetical protein
MKLTTPIFRPRQRPEAAFGGHNVVHLEGKDNHGRITPALTGKLFRGSRMNMGEFVPVSTIFAISLVHG